MSDWMVLKMNKIDEINKMDKNMRVLIMQNNQLTENIIKLNENFLRLKKNFKEEIHSIKDTLTEISSYFEGLKLIIEKCDVL